LPTVTAAEFKGCMWARGKGRGGCRGGGDTVLTSLMKNVSCSSNDSGEGEVRKRVKVGGTQEGGATPKWQGSLQNEGMVVLKPYIKPVDLRGGGGGGKTFESGKPGRGGGTKDRKKKKSKEEEDTDRSPRSVGRMNLSGGSRGKGT